MYQFVHIPKTGGIALQSFLIKHYRWDLLLSCSVEHNISCSYYVDSIAVIREPIERFMSMYRFWKYGSDKMKASEKIGTIKDYIYYISINDNSLIDVFTKEAHYIPQYTWIPKDTWNKVIILKYKSDMSESASELLRYLDIPQKTKLEHKNVSNGSRETLDDKDLEWIKEYYKKDFELCDTINNNPSLFKKVI